MEGPFYIDRALVRQDITEGKAGVPLDLSLAVADADGCRRLAGAAVDIWHCDAIGVYSGYDGAAAISPVHVDPIDGRTFLRGTQTTDAHA